MLVDHGATPCFKQGLANLINCDNVEAAEALIAMNLERSATSVGTSTPHATWIDRSDPNQDHAPPEGMQATGTGSMDRFAPFDSEWPLLHHAQSTEMVAMLVKRGVGINLACGATKMMTPLVCAVQRHRVDVIAALLVRGADVNLLCGGEEEGGGMKNALAYCCETLARLEVPTGGPAGGSAGGPAAHGTTEQQIASFTSNQAANHAANPAAIVGTSMEGVDGAPPLIPTVVATVGGIRSVDDLLSFSFSSTVRSRETALQAARILLALGTHATHDGATAGDRHVGSLADELPKTAMIRLVRDMKTWKMLAYHVLGGGLEGADSAAGIPTVTAEKVAEKDQAPNCTVTAQRAEWKPLLCSLHGNMGVFFLSCYTYMDSEPDTMVTREWLTSVAKKMRPITKLPFTADVMRWHRFRVQASQLIRGCTGRTGLSDEIVNYGILLSCATHVHKQLAVASAAAGSVNGLVDTFRRTCATNRKTPPLPFFINQMEIFHTLQRLAAWIEDCLDMGMESMTVKCQTLQGWVAEVTGVTGVTGVAGVTVQPTTRNAVRAAPSLKSKSLSQSATCSATCDDAIEAVVSCVQRDIVCQIARMGEMRRLTAWGALEGSVG